MDLNKNSRAFLVAACKRLNVNHSSRFVKEDLTRAIAAHARTVTQSIFAITCLDARQQFRDLIGRTLADVLLTRPLVTKEVSLPWKGTPVSYDALVRSVEDYSREVLHEMLKHLNLPIQRGSNRKNNLARMLVDSCVKDLNNYREERIAHNVLIDLARVSVPTISLRATFADALMIFLYRKWGPRLFVAMLCDYEGLSPHDRQASRLQVEAMVGACRLRAEVDAVDAQWPRKVPEVVKLDCMRAYCEASSFDSPGTCACCARARVDVPVRRYDYKDGLPYDLTNILAPPEDDPVCTLNPTALVYDDPKLNGLLLCPDGLDIDRPAQKYIIAFCPECEEDLGRGTIPKFSLRNGLFRGYLPPFLRDLTFIEEQVCALYRVTANITRLFGANSKQPNNPWHFYGNTCAHPLNAVQTADILPRTVADMNQNIGILFVGPGKHKPNILRKIFRVRRAKVIALSQFLRSTNVLFRKKVWDFSRFDEYPLDDALPGLDERIIVDESQTGEAALDEEAREFDDHPAMAASRLQPGEEFVFLERFGVTDATSERVQSRTFDSAALMSLVPEGYGVPSMTLHRGSEAQKEYNNPDLFPGMFPALFPFGIGGFEGKRPVKVAFQTHAEYLLDLKDRAFAMHPVFAFVVVNILQRRVVHNETRYRITASRFKKLAPEILQVDGNQIARVAQAVAEGTPLSRIPEKDKIVLKFMHEAEAVAARVPGSHMAKVDLRRRIRGYFGHFGLPHVFFTANPNPVHSPLFHLMFGDESIDLSQRYPAIAPALVRSSRVALDPAVAAKFFDLSIRLMFEHLFGWDFENKRSKPDGGILGHIRAWAGSIEMTARHIPHFHVEIWLRGGMNPQEVHERMRSSNTFQARFFEFFEDAIHHHLPTFSHYAANADEFPRTQRPPLPPRVPDEHRQLLSARGLEVVRDEYELPGSNLAQTLPGLAGFFADYKEFKSEFLWDVKKLGEEVQRHVHRPVCKAYGYTRGPCRFLFPHEVVDKSSFDPSTNSITLRCLDGNVNYFNPETFAMVRHNMDMKCILSGKAAQAAMFYISNYITKMDLPTHQILTLMSQAVMAAPRSVKPGEPLTVRHLMHRCLAQFNRNSQMHAQRAIRFIRGHKDYMVSHDHAPMMSSMLMDYVKKTHAPELFAVVLPVDTPVHDENPDNDRDGTAEDEDNDQDLIHGRDVFEITEIADAGPDKEPSVQLFTDETGKLRYSDQVQDYLYRPSELASCSFYDFVRLYVVRKKTRKEHGATLILNLHPKHRLATTHRLFCRHKDAIGSEAHEFVPAMMGVTIPRRADNDYYRLFCLAHFKPFSAFSPLLPPNCTVSETFATYVFSDTAKRCIANWEDVHECEDERDADRLRQLAKKTEKFALPPPTDDDGGDGAYFIDPGDAGTAGANRESRETYLALHEGGWFNRSIVWDEDRCVEPVFAVCPGKKELSRMILTWNKELAAANTALTNERAMGENGDSILPQTTEEDSTLGQDEDEPAPVHPPRTVPVDLSSIPKLTRELADDFAVKYNFNPEQRQAYDYMTDWLLRLFDANDPFSVPPRRVIFHGPGGTGKTYCVKALQDLLEHVGKPGAIVRVAPTGNAAALIDGQTIHGAYKIKISHSSREGEDETVDVMWTPSQKRYVEGVFESALLILIDEVSLLGCALMAQTDAGARCAKGNFDDFFGGLSVILAGDFCQYPPVLAKALYSPTSNKTDAKKGASGLPTLNRLGRLAYKSFEDVIEFKQQERMKKDPEFGHAVRRLRVRECVPEDVRLFNSCLVKDGSAGSDGVDISGPEWADAPVITASNEARRDINMLRARQYAADVPSLVTIYAHDVLTAASKDSDFTPEDQKALWRVTLGKQKAAGTLAFYVGCPVIFRQRNLSVGLKATNGARGILRELHVEDDGTGHPYVLLALVEIPGSPAGLSFLPPSVVPVTPTSVSQTVTIGGKTFTVNRRQIALEPAFAITGHAAQGQTIAKVICDPGRPGFYKYVSISRARSRNDVVTLRPVTLAQLNDPLPEELRFELKRLQVMARNTSIRMGHAKGVVVPIPVHPKEIKQLGLKVRGLSSSEAAALSAAAAAAKAGPESADSTSPAPLLRRTTSTSKAESTTAKRSRTRALAKKRKANELDSYDFPRPKAAPTVPRPPSPASDILNNLCPFYCPKWDSVDHSCAYDTVFASLLAACVAKNPDWRLELSFEPGLLGDLGKCFLALPRHPREEHALSFERDAFRDAAYQLEPRRFLRRGPVVADIMELLELLLLGDIGAALPCTARDVCSSCGVCLAHAEGPIVPNMGFCDFLQDAEFTVASWFSLAVADELSGRLPPSSCCGLVNRTFGLEGAPQFVYFGSHESCLVDADLVFTSENETGCSIYRLCAVLYSDDEHYTSRLIFEGSVWVYDGMITNGRPMHEYSIGLQSALNLRRRGNSVAIAYVYVRDSVIENGPAAAS